MKIFTTKQFYKKHNTQKFNIFRYHESVHGDTKSIPAKVFLKYLGATRRSGKLHFSDAAYTMFMVKWS